MKLLTKTSIYYTLFLIPILLISATFFYFFTLHEVGESSENLLSDRVDVIKEYLKENDTISVYTLQENKELNIKEISIGKTIPNTFSDTLIYSTSKKVYIANKVLKTSFVLNDKNYSISVWKSTIEIYELIEVIFYTFLILIILLLLISIYINSRISKRIWQPFWLTLEQLKKFRVTNNNVGEFEKTEIIEFNELNQSVSQMMNKMIVDFNNQKKFSENASHELQTPLAIIKSKVELLLQSENLKENDVHTLLSIDDSLVRLNRINKALLLLSKIENRQFIASSIVPINEIIKNKISLNEEFLNNKKINLVFHSNSELSFQMNPELSYVLVNNLLQNAIRHNYEGGIINIEIKDKSLFISNSGSKKSLDINKIFNRFEKESNQTNSIGLGLSICKEIAEVSNLKLAYTFENDLHIFCIKQSSIDLLK